MAASSVPCWGQELPQKNRATARFSLVMGKTFITLKPANAQQPGPLEKRNFKELPACGYQPLQFGG
jgi:hypothetical protein